MKEVGQCPTFFCLLLNLNKICYIYILEDGFGLYIHWVHIIVVVAISFYSRPLCSMDKKSVQEFLQSIITIFGIGIGLILLYTVSSYLWSIFKTFFNIIF
jgi:hypothetical protein